MIGAAVDTAAFAALARKLDPGAHLLRAWPLTGGVSARATALEIVRAGGETHKWVVRQHGQADLAANPQIAADEFRLLQIVHEAGIPVPAPIAFDESGEILPTPYVVVEFVEGAPDFAPLPVGEAVDQFAALLAQIHAVDRRGLSFLPQRMDRTAASLSERPARIDPSLAEGRIRAMLDSVWPLAPRNPSALLHGDFWPGNLLWKDGRIAAVLDWEDAALGDPLADVANTRLELLWAFGAGAMEGFSERYQSLTALDFADLPYWDLAAALHPLGKFTQWAADDRAARDMREKHGRFVAQAFEKLSENP